MPAIFFLVIQIFYHYDVMGLILACSITIQSRFNVELLSCSKNHECHCVKKLDGALLATLIALNCNHLCPFVFFSHKLFSLRDLHSTTAKIQLGKASWIAGP